MEPRVAAVVPVGPKCRRDFVEDTLESIFTFTPDVRLVIVDDSRSDLGTSIARRYGAVLCPAIAQGTRGALYLNLSAGFAQALRAPFDILLRIDTDALLTGARYAREARTYFSRHPDVGCLGSYRFGYDTQARSRRWARAQLLRHLAAGPLLAPTTTATLIRLLARAVPRGYRLGEAVMGGACIYSAAAISDLHKNGLLGRPELARTGLEEDHIFGLCLRAVGYRMADFGTREDSGPMGVKHVGLPAAPDELVANGKCVVHSTKGCGQMAESEIRAAFRRMRNGPSGSDRGVVPGP